MNATLLRALEKFVMEVKFEISKYDEHGYQNKDLQEACDRLEGLLDAEAEHAEKMQDM